MANFPQLDDNVGVWKLKDVNNAVSGGYWRQGGSRGIFAGGKTPDNSDVIDFVIIASAGNATDFGNLIAARNQTSGMSSHTRGVMGGGHAPAKTNTNIGYITMTTTGNETDFGDLTVGRSAFSGASNSTRGLFMGGMTPTRQNVIDFVTIASVGNAVDFGNLQTAISSSASVVSPTRAIKAGGNTPYISK